MAKAKAKPAAESKTSKTVDFTKEKAKAEAEKIATVGVTQLWAQVGKLAVQIEQQVAQRDAATAQANVPIQKARQDAADILQQISEIDRAFDTSYEGLNQQNT